MDSVAFIKEKIALFIKRGAIQLSRKYRHIAVPYDLIPNTYLDLLRQRNPREWERLEEIAKNQILHSDPGTHVHLTKEEFNEWLIQRGCAPNRYSE